MQETSNFEILGVCQRRLSSTHVLSTWRKHTTESLANSFGECVGCRLLLGVISLCSCSVVGLMFKLIHFANSLFLFAWNVLNLMIYENVELI